ncbi:hypothetical protein CRX72_27895 [Pantoea sp. BRM17]|nr:hypothetical protein CRX72_27895 [Pantoea sp. BRM17]
MKEKLSWLGKMDSGSLKNKVAASIVAISSIHLLRIFMDARNVANDKLMWYVIIHLTFVLSAFVMGWLLGLLALTVKFFQEIFHLLPNILSIAENDLILLLLSLVDMTLVGGLLVMVMLSGYENFVSKLDIAEHGGAEFRLSLPLPAPPEISEAALK